MLSDEVTKILNRQINLEQYSANLYMQMSAWCDFKGLEGCAAFLSRHAEDETAHMRRLFNYVAETGSLPIMGQVKAPPTDFESVIDVFRQTYAHEQLITKSINGLVQATFDAGDFSTFHFLQWYVAEQHEEEHLFKTVLDKIELTDVTGPGLFLFDKEISGLGFKQGG